MGTLYPTILAAGSFIHGGTGRTAKKEERKDRLYQNYLKRKANGAQKRYEDKIKAKKRAEMDAKKALIRAENMKKGVFSTGWQLSKGEPRKCGIAASAAV